MVDESSRNDLKVVPAEGACQSKGVAGLLIDADGDSPGDANDESIVIGAQAQIAIQVQAGIADIGRGVIVLNSSAGRTGNAHPETTATVGGLARSGIASGLALCHYYRSQRCADNYAGINGADMGITFGVDVAGSNRF